MIFTKGQRPAVNTSLQPPSLDDLGAASLDEIVAAVPPCKKLQAARERYREIEHQLAEVNRSFAEQRERFESTTSTTIDLNRSALLHKDLNALEQQLGQQMLVIRTLARSHGEKVLTALTPVLREAAQRALDGLAQFDVASDVIAEIVNKALYAGSTDIAPLPVWPSMFAEIEARLQRMVDL
jgi:hypothetical protein